MKKEFSAGIVLCKPEYQTVNYLLLHYVAGHWDFPKGHIEHGETKHQAALRELKEETGLSAEIVEGFQHSIEYYFTYPQSSQLIHKTVYFFLGRPIVQEVILSDEHINFEWLDFKAAYQRLTYHNARVLLKKAHNFIIKTDF